MLLQSIFWAAALSTVSASPLPCVLGICGTVGNLVSAVCDKETALWPCSRPPNPSNASRDEAGKVPSSLLYAHPIAKRQDSGGASSEGPPLGPILGGVLGGIGGLAIAGAIFYAWWSIRRVNQKHAANRTGASSSFGPGVQSQTRQQTSKDSKGSSSGSRQSQKKVARGWQDPWLAPAPKSPRPVSVSVVKHERASSANEVVQDDRGSDSSAMPLKVMCSNVEEEPGNDVRDES